MPFLLKLSLLSLFLLSSSELYSKPLSVNSLVSDIVQEGCHNKTVLLGEPPTHGEAIAFQIKSEIVKHLVTECGFKNIYFEAPLYDFLGFQQALKNNNASIQQLNDAIGGFWNTKELMPWKKWLFDMASESKIHILGLDDQISRTSNFAKVKLPELVKKHINPTLTVQCLSAIDRYLNWSYTAETSYDEDEKLLLAECAQNSFENLNGESEINIIELKMLESFSNQFLRSHSPMDALNRDQQMYENFKWQQNIHKEKAIIWTSTPHAAKVQGHLKFKPLGAYVFDSTPDDSYSVGFSAYAGQSSMAGGPIKDIGSAPEGSLEDLVNSSDSEWLIMRNKELQDIAEIPSRLFGKFKKTLWHQFFDTVVIIKKEQAPTFE